MLNHQQVYKGNVVSAKQDYKKIFRYQPHSIAWAKVVLSVIFIIIFFGKLSNY